MNYEKDFSEFIKSQIKESPYDFALKQFKKADNEIFKLVNEVAVKDSLILNFLDNWNYLRDTLSWVKEPEFEDGEYWFDEVLEECDPKEFLNAKKFSEDFAMNVFRNLFEIINKKYSINSLDDHENFKNIFWEYLQNSANTKTL